MFYQVQKDYEKIVGFWLIMRLNVSTRIMLVWQVRKNAMIAFGKYSREFKSRKWPKPTLYIYIYINGDRSLEMNYILGYALMYNQLWFERVDDWRKEKLLSSMAQWKNFTFLIHAIDCRIINPSSSSYLHTWLSMTETGVCIIY